MDRWDILSQPFRIDSERTLKGEWGRESKLESELPSSLLVMARSCMWSALARIFCSAHVGTGSETTVEQESQKLYHLRICRRTKLLQVATTGRTGLLEHGHRRRIRRGRRTFQGLLAGTEPRTPPPIPPGPQYLSGTTGLTETRTD
jgi:hypothetical protein